MLQSLCRFGLTAALFGLLFVPGAAWGQKEARPRHVHDEAKLFSKEAIAQANVTIDKIKKAHGKDLFIESVESGEKDKDARTKWAKQRFNDFGVDGIYIVVSKEPSFYRWFVGDNTREKGYFTKANIDKLDENLKQITKAGKRDEALIEAANYVLESMNEHARAKANVAPPKANVPVAQGDARKPVQRQQPVAHPDVQENSMPPWVGWVCAIVAVLVVVWVIFAIIRAMTGAMGGGGYGYGGGGYGGGGGGFFTGMLGGMFGAMAGMWIYNNMFGGHASYGHDGNVNWGGNQGAAGTSEAPYEADTSAGGTGGGGDDDAGGGGGDAGGDDDAGGGEWGGGDDAGGADAGGGGDWGGGGGGDVGGGGDWGGGGGDWGGGGGGDFGGGGGGGDW